MQRAAVLIGVSKTGALQQLRAVTDGIKRMRVWAEDQRFQRIKILTDDAGPVRVEDVKKIIKEIVDSRTCEQLIVYFAGHGVNIAKGERWLLTDAPEDGNAAVNVPGSELQARFCKIPHVVFISDACRTAADGIQAQGVIGSEIFPNFADGGLEQPVALFFASTLGSPALEIKDPAVAATGYVAAYTTAITRALEGEVPEVIETDEPLAFVRPRPLKKYLAMGVADLFAAAKVNPAIGQRPDARINSDGSAWLSQFSLRDRRDAPLPPPDIDSMFRGAVPFRKDVNATRYDRTSEKEPPAEPPATLLTVGGEMLRGVLAGKTPVVDNTVPHATLLEAAVARAGTTFGVEHLRCGFKVLGSQVAEAHSELKADVLGDEFVRVHLDAAPAGNVWIRFRDNRSVVLPAIRDYVAALTFEDNELVSVSYEPAVTGPFFDVHKVAEACKLRAVIAAAARFGVFRLEGENALAVAQRLQYAKVSDPSMALYAAYAYHDLQQSRRIDKMQDYLVAQLSIRLFDIALLAHTIKKQTLNAQTLGVQRMFPQFPMLTQGWALLNAFGAALPPPLMNLQSCLAQSLWTLFTPTGTDLLKKAWAAGEVR